MQKRWIRIKQRIVGDDNEVLKQWKYEGEDEKYSVTVREFYSDWGEISHVAILKNFINAYVFHHPVEKEPLMAEKVKILRGVMKPLGQNEVAMEIYPAKNNIVDNLDMYHIWIAKKSELPFLVDVEVRNWYKLLFNWRDSKVKDIVFKKQNLTSKTGITVTVYYLKSISGKELRWKEKQTFKDEILGEDVVAIEFIQDVSQETNISALVCVPEGIKIPFGLKNSSAKS